MKTASYTRENTTMKKTAPLRQTRYGVLAFAVLLGGCASSEIAARPASAPKQPLNIHTFHFSVVQTESVDHIQEKTVQLAAKDGYRLVISTLTGTAPDAGMVTYRPEDFACTFSGEHGLVTDSPAGLHPHFVLKLMGGRNVTIEPWILHYSVYVDNGAGGHHEEGSGSVNQPVEKGEHLELRVACIAPKTDSSCQLRMPAGDVVSICSNASTRAQ